MLSRHIRPLAAAFWLALSSGTVQADTGSLRLGGSTTLVPVVASAASTFMDTYESWRQVDASLPDTRVVVYVTGGGSGFGVKSVTNGTVEIGMASRALKNDEQQAIGQHEEHLVGKDAVAIVAHKDNPLVGFKNNLTSADVRKIFSGDYKRYDDIDASLPSKEIVLLVRDAGAGSTEILQDTIMGDSTISNRALQMPSQGALLKKLEATPQALAYASSGLAMENDKLTVFMLDGIMPSDENVVAGKYPMARPLLLIVKGKATPTARHFIDFMLSKGQESVLAHGFVPVQKQAVAAH